LLYYVHDCGLLYIMKCWHCNTELIWGGDFTYEDYGLEDEGIVSNLSCPNDLCEAYVEVYLKLKDDDEEDNSEEN